MIDSNLLKGFLVFITGAMLGSFLNVVIYRLPREKSLVWPGSKCPKCNNEIAAYDNIPILSWLLLMGKCRYCKEPISFRYPFIELLTASLFLLTYVNFGLDWRWVFLAYFISVLLVISWIDIDYMLILNSLSYPALIIGLLYNFINGKLTESILGSIIGSILFYLIVKLSTLIFKKEGMGMGDVILVAVLGAWLGWQNLIGTIILSFILGSVIGLALLFKRGKSDYFPFGPSLAIGAIITLFSDNYLLNWYVSKFF